MMKNAWNTLCLGVLVLAVALLTSCETSSAGAASSIGTEKYVMGTYSLVFASPIFSTDKAIRAAAARAKFVEEARINNLQGIDYMYRDFYDNKIAINLKATSDNQSLVKVTVGKLGNKIASQEILRAIGEELQTALPGAGL